MLKSFNVDVNISLTIMLLTLIGIHIIVNYVSLPFAADNKLVCRIFEHITIHVVPEIDFFKNF